MDKQNITTEGPAAQAVPVADPVQMALEGKWTLEASGDDWGARATVYAPSPSILGRKIVAVGTPMPIAEKMVRAVNAHDALLSAVVRAQAVLSNSQTFKGPLTDSDVITELLGILDDRNLVALVNEAKAVV